MLSKTIIAAALALGTASIPALAEPARQQPAHKVSMKQARDIALAKVPGTVKHEELEKEHGRWIYSFEIRPKGGKAGQIKEVNVDADDGKIVAVEDEEETTEGDRED